MSVVRRYSPLNFQETSSLCIRLRLAFVNSLRWGLSPQFKASLPKHLQLLAGCRHMSGSFMYFGIQTVTKYLEICGHRPLKALILEVIFFFFKSWKDDETSSSEFSWASVCSIYPVSSFVSPPKHNTHFSRMKSKINVLLPWVTSVGGDWFVDSRTWKPPNNAGYDLWVPLACNFLTHCWLFENHPCNHGSQGNSGFCTRESF